MSAARPNQRRQRVSIDQDERAAGPARELRDTKFSICEPLAGHGSTGFQNPRAGELTKVPPVMELLRKASSCLWTANIFG
jgi:hypothetical protein